MLKKAQGKRGGGLREYAIERENPVAFFHKDPHLV
jgi:hypothetical protein